MRQSSLLGGTATAGFSNDASGLSKVGNLGGGPGNSIIFEHIRVPSAGVSVMEIDYATSGERTLYVTVNQKAPRQWVLRGSTFDDPVPAIIHVALKAGNNTVEMGNPNPDGFAPDLDLIVIAPRADLSWAGSRATTQTCAARPADAR